MISSKGNILKFNGKYASHIQEKKIQLVKAAEEKKKEKERLEAQRMQKWKELPRTAICISGHMRTFEKCRNSFFRAIRDKFPNPDIFLCTWDEIGSHKKSGDNKKKKFAHHNKIKIAESYEATKYLFLPSHKNNEFIQQGSQIRARIGREIRVHPGFMISMYWMIQKCDIMRREYQAAKNFKYNQVIRLRPDMFFENRFDLLWLKPNKIHIPYFGNYGGYNDRFAIGNDHDMTIYSNLYDHIFEYYNAGVLFNPERYLKHHLDKNNISVEKVNIEFYQPRLNGKKWVDEDKLPKNRISTPS